MIWVLGCVQIGYARALKLQSAVTVCDQALRAHAPVPGEGRRS
jgi:hypothetical protein